MHFNPLDGRIWLDDRRMVLVHAEAFGTLRQELIACIGSEAARALLTRAGYVAGSRDALLAWKVRGGGSKLDVAAAGAQFHALQGFVSVEPIRAEIDSARGHCYAEFIWKHSVEADAHVAAGGNVAEPACWMEVGYSSGFMSTLMGKRILVREVECRAMGHAECRVIAKPAEAWDDAELSLRYFEPVPGNCAPPSVKPTTPPQAAVQPLRSSPGSVTSGNIIGASAAYHLVMHKIRRVAQTNATVLLLGESGVGKSLFAREVHAQSRRAKSAFVEVNCAAIPEQLMESELFGVERGAYSGASEARSGRFEVANNGTIFLDEIGTLSFTAQGKLLRVLQTGELERLGSTRTQKVDVRVVAATNEDLPKAVKEGRFREDLFYRLNVFPITIPPLRERKDDIPVVLEFFLQKFMHYHGRNISGITPRALRALLAYSWPGNIRELENVMERGVILADEGEPLDIHHVFSADAAFGKGGVFRLGPPAGALSKLNLLESNYDAGDPSPMVGGLAPLAEAVVKERIASLSEVETALVRAALEQASGNVSKAATLLGISRAQMDYRVKKLTEEAESRGGLSVPDTRQSAA
jgi:DNA-binding NtrC family response regulator/predicted hydrocarbon binding protein